MPVRIVAEDRLKIAIIGPYFWPQLYGIEKVMYSHAKHLALLGHDVMVITSRLRFPTGSDEALPPLETRDGFKIRRLQVLLRSPMLFHYPSNGGVAIPRLGQTLRDFSPNVVHAHNIGASAWALGGAIHARRRKAAFFYSPHHHPNALRLGTIRKAFLQATNYLPIRTASRIYHLTKRDFDIFPAEYRYAPVDRFSVLLNGVDPPTLARDAGHDPMNVLFVGRVDDPRKGFAVLEAAIDALPAAARERFELTVIGSVGEATRDRLNAKHGSKIRVLGPVSEEDLERAYARADIFVMPSLYEGFGMPYIEAMRYGIPVIGTAVGGIPEVVPHGTGLLTAPNDVGAVSRALDTLFENPSQRAGIGMSGKEWSRRFHWQNIVSGLAEDYHEGVSKL